MKVDALAAAGDGSSLARQRAGSVGADKASLASLGAASAVVAIGLGVHANVVAVGESCLAGEGAGSVGADFTAFAGSATSSAVLGVCLELDTASITGVLSCGTG